MKTAMEYAIEQHDRGIKRAREEVISKAQFMQRELERLLRDMEREPKYCPYVGISNTFSDLVAESTKLRTLTEARNELVNLADLVEKLAPESEDTMGPSDYDRLAKEGK